MTYNVIQGRWFWHNWKRVLDFLLALNSNEINLGPILPRFRNIRAFVRQKPKAPFRYPSSILAKISACSIWSRSVMLGSAEHEHPKQTNSEIILEELQPIWYLNVTDRQTDRQTTLS